MTNRLGLISWATGTLLLAAASACGSSNANPPTNTPSSSSSSPTATATQQSPSTKASASASAALRRYFAVLDEVRQDRSKPLSQLGKVAVSTQMNAEKDLVISQRTKRLHQTGATKVVKLTVQAVNLDNSDPASGKVPTVTIDACWDVSGADLVDKNGKSAVSANRPDRGWTRYTVANYHWSTNPTGGWRVASSQDLDQPPCSAS